MPSLTASSSSSSSLSSPRCVPFAGRRGTRSRRLSSPAPAPAAHGGQGCVRPLGRAVCGGIATAFFVSLERCACVEVRTVGDESFNKEADMAPLMPGGGGDSAGAAAAAASGGRRAPAGNGKGRRSGFGCFDTSAVD
ncbi:hypothetical protein ACP70R_045485 [Stipagrostis hirtigluma subsp. patula]